MGANDLSAVLWHERELLELLVFKLGQQQLILSSGSARWLQHATREIDQVVERLRTSGLGLSIEIETVASTWGAAPTASLRELAAAAPAPWGEILLDHLRALTDLTSEIGQARETNEAQLRAAMRDALRSASPATAPGTYDASGSASRARHAASLFDREV